MILVLGLLTNKVSVSSVGVNMIEFVSNANCPQIDNKKSVRRKGIFILTSIIYFSFNHINKNIF
jgi:hypothetical protein